MHQLLVFLKTFPPFVNVKTRVPVHLRLVSSLFEALRSLQSKFSSQNSANHTFLRLFSRVSAVKYSSNPGMRGRRRMAQFRTNYQPAQTWRKRSAAAWCWKSTSKRYFITIWTLVVPLPLEPRGT